jgi:hypothetical protein
MHYIPLPQYIFYIYYSQPYFKLKWLDKLMHYMVPLYFYTHNFVIEEVIHYIKELYNFSHKWIKSTLHSFSHSLIIYLRVPYPGKERMFIVQISVLIVTLLSLISLNLSWMQTTKEGNPHPRIAPCVNKWSVTFLFLFLFLFFWCHLLNVDACVRHIAREGQVEWTTLA